jgi:hypothetical protein
MARFTVRVELHNADGDDYEGLHKAMANEGFSRTITFGITTYNLPTAEYNLSANIDKRGALTRAKRAAAKTGLTYSVLVTESNGRISHGLSVTKAQRR